MILNAKSLSFSDIQNQTGVGKTLFIGVLYFSGFMLIMALNQIVFSDKYKASWIYFVAPIKLPGTLLSGTVKSVLVKFYLPIVLFISILGIGIVGPKILPNLLLGMLNQVLIIYCIAYITLRDLPFSIQQSMQQKGGNFIKGIFSLIIPGIFVLIHYLLYDFIWAVILLSILSAIAIWLVGEALKDKGWNKILSRNYE